MKFVLGSRVKTRRRLLLVATLLILILWLVLSWKVLQNGSEGVAGGDDSGVVKKSPREPSAKQLFAADSAARQATETGDCSARRSCLLCLFPGGISTNGSAPIAIPSRDCVWCASTAACVSAGAQETVCEDVERDACPAILLTKTPQNHRVIHVGIRKGGPEALVQMHLALNHWGFTTTLDTRHSMKEKGGPVMPFFIESYKKEFASAPPLRWVKNYDDWHKSAVEGDVMIATETWACKPNREWYLPRGVRQFQWHLTVWPRRDRSQCTIAGHTNYVARDYMRQSVRSLMYPYISPHIIALAQTRASWKDRKTDLVLYDSDTHLKDADLESRRGVTRSRRLASGLTPPQLYELYQTAKAGIDLQLPGGERFVYEAALFDVCVVVDNALNGGDREDFPIPDRFRVKPNDLEALNAAVDECISNYAAVIDEFAPLKHFVLKQRVTFLRQVRRYFSNSVHIVTVACSEEDLNLFFARFLLNVLVQLPFAVVEVFVPPGVSLSEETRNVLHSNSLLAAVFVTEMARTVSSDVCGQAGLNDVESHSLHLSRIVAAIPPTTNAKRTLLTMWMPISAIVMSEDLVHVAATHLSGLDVNNAATQGAAVCSMFVLRIDHPMAAVDNASRAAHFLPLVAVWTRDVPTIQASCRAPGPPRASNNGGGEWMFSCSASSALNSFIAPIAASQQMDFVGELLAVVDTWGGVLWGGKQMLDETVVPLLCTHELWRSLVGRHHTTSSSALGCRGAS